MKKQVTELQFEAVNLPIRKLDIDLAEGFDRHWFANDPFRTAFYNALSMIFPAGEQIFMNSVKAGLAVLPVTAEHAALRKQCQDFSAQEATHRHVHAQYNAVLEKQGLHNHAEKRVWEMFNKSKHRLSVRHCLGLTIAYEHYTAVFSAIHLSHPQVMAKASPQMNKLWNWHFLEETEHKAVAFDLYTALDGNYSWRVRWYRYVAFQFFLSCLRQTVNNLWHDETLFRISTWQSAAKFLFGRPKLGGGIVWLAAKPLFDYFKRDFHPWQHNNLGVAQAYAKDNSENWKIVR
jgi:uncharacterized protein